MKTTFVLLKQNKKSTEINSSINKKCARSVQHTAILYQVFKNKVISLNLESKAFLGSVEFSMLSSPRFYQFYPHQGLLVK